MGRRVEFWYELASTYSYLSAMRIEAEARVRGATVIWKPFLLGPIFRAQGWETSPFTLYPAKGRYMVRDMERLCAARGLPFALPDLFPQNSLHAARLALLGMDEGWGPAFSKGVYRAQFGSGANIADHGVLAGLLTGLGIDAGSSLAHSSRDDVKARLRTQTEEAQARGVFGAPTLITADGELFWGDDRLEQALDWEPGS